MIIVTLCDDDRPDERKCVVHYSIPTNFKTWGFNFNNALEMRFQILFQQTADRQQTADLSRQRSKEINHCCFITTRTVLYLLIHQHIFMKYGETFLCPVIFHGSLAATLDCFSHTHAKLATE